MKRVSLRDSFQCNLSVTLAQKLILATSFFILFFFIAANLISQPEWRTNKRTGRIESTETKTNKQTKKLKGNEKAYICIPLWCHGRC